MKSRLLLTFAMISALAVTAKAQGVETPPVSSFQPDTSMPRVNVPEFVVTGKTRIELPKVNKPFVEIDSAYFQNKEIAGVPVDAPAGQSISTRARQNVNPANLFALASIGHYNTARYLLSGGGGIGGYVIDGSLSGDYTSGFIPYTISRDFSVRGGVAKDFTFDPGIVTTNALDVAYSRDSYFLYGGIYPMLQRIMNDFSATFQSGVSVGEFPLNGELTYRRTSLNDPIISGVGNRDSRVSLALSTGVGLPSGSLALGASVKVGSHFISTRQITLNPYGVLGIDRSNYMVAAGIGYVNNSDNFFYSLGANYFQYTDDRSSGIGKLYPDLSATYRINERVSMFASYSGTINEQSISSILSTDRYVDSDFLLVSTQDYADLKVGGNINVTDEIRITPQFRIQAMNNYPVYVTPRNGLEFGNSDGSDNTFFYARQATLYSPSITCDYALGPLTASGDLLAQWGKADSLSSIPNLPPVMLNLKAAYQLGPGFTITAGLLFLSSRYADLSLTQKINPATRLNFKLAYDFHIQKLPVEVFAGGNNIFNQKYFIWQSYREFPLTLYVGLSSRIL